MLSLKKLVHQSDERTGVANSATKLQISNSRRTPAIRRSWHFICGFKFVKNGDGGAVLPRDLIS